MENNNSESRSARESLELFLYQLLSNAVKRLCLEWKTQKKNNSAPAFVSIQRPYESKHFCKRLKNPVTGQTVVRLEIPEDVFDGIEDVERIKGRLGEWHIQRRQRPSKAIDTYFYHLASGQMCRSIQEVQDFVVDGPKPKRRGSDIGSSIQVDERTSSSEPPADMDWSEDTGFLDLLCESNDNAITPHQNQHSQDICGPAEKFTTFEEFMQNLACVELEGVTDTDAGHFNHGVQLSTHDHVNDLFLSDYDMM